MCVWRRRCVPRCATSRTAPTSPGAPAPPNDALEASISSTGSVPPRRAMHGGKDRSPLYRPAGPGTQRPYIVVERGVQGGSRPLSGLQGRLPGRFTLGAQHQGSVGAKRKSNDHLLDPTLARELPGVTPYFPSRLQRSHETTRKDRQGIIDHPRSWPLTLSCLTVALPPAGANSTGSRDELPGLPRGLPLA